MRKFVSEIANNGKAAFEDWIEFASDYEGIDITIFYENKMVKLPDILKAASDKLKEIVPDEIDVINHKTFNGNRYCLMRFESDIRGVNEKSICNLFFCNSDYRTFLVTNGIDQEWARNAGLGEIWINNKDWNAKWNNGDDFSPFYLNSFGINVLFTISDNSGNKVAIFRERSKKIAVNKNIMVATVDEGIRRKSKDKLFDETSEIDGTPNIWNALERSCYEETGIILSDIKKKVVKLLTVGIVKSIFQPTAMFHVDLDITKEEFEHACHIAKDSKHEFDSSHYIPFKRENIVDFIIQNEEACPVASWVVALAFYSLGNDAILKRRLFLSHSTKDKSFVRGLAKKLEKNGFRVWIDEAEIKYGESLIHKISDAIFENTEVIIGIISKNSINSEWVKKELDWAMTKEINNKRYCVIPVVIEDCDLPNYLKGKLYADFIQPTSGKYKKLYSSIRHV